MAIELDLNLASYESVSGRLQGLHDRLLEVAPDVERVACALYDPAEDMLKTFINSTRNGEAIRAYQYRLSDSESLSYLARSKELRLLTDIQSTLEPTTMHSQYVLQEGYQSSFTVPMYHQGEFLGFIFFDSRKTDTFTAHVQRELLLYSSIITMAIATELMAVRSVVGAVQITRGLTEMRDHETGAHLDRMSRYARLITTNLIEPMDLTDEFAEHVFLYAPLHDIGKIAIPDRILLKPGRLDPDEWEIMKTHTTKGREMVEQITSDLRLDALPNDEILRNIVELHHERLDGSGYPHGLKGDDIPLEARIVAVADMLDAMTITRPYKRPWALADVESFLQEEAARGKLDQEVVNAMLRARPQVAELHDRYPEVT